MSKLLIAIPLALMSVSGQSQDREPRSGTNPVEVPSTPPAPDGTPPAESPPVEAPPMTPPAPDVTPTRAGSAHSMPNHTMPNHSMPNHTMPPGTTSPMEAPQAGAQPAAMPGMARPQSGMPGEGMASGTDNNPSSAAASPQVYPPCSATVQDQCQQREGRKARGRKSR